MQVRVRGCHGFLVGSRQPDGRGVALIGFMYTVWRDARRAKEISQHSTATEALREILAKQQERLGLKKEEMAWKQLEGIAKARRLKRDGAIRRRACH